jgi:Zn-dependent M16 (insulinase) family peptidase
MLLEIGAVVFGFSVQSVTALPDVDGRMWRLTYEKNGAELVWLERPDPVKTFAIAFKTLPDDHTGVAHILEHAVLSGSAKYPVKSPFDELRKSSLRVFMNAMTARDTTYYPFSTRNDRDFLNLADVYLDAVFDPGVLRSPLAFRQEGWHYEIDAQTGALSYNGVVYNEMKGVFADPERTASREVINVFFPDTVYGRDSGGRPEAIPDLTYANFCAFYKKFYHPSNARIFLDGRVDLPAILAKLDGYLGRYPRAASVPEIPRQKPFTCAKRFSYAATDCTRRTILADAWLAGGACDVERRGVLDVLESYLAGSNEAPLKKALLSQGLCEDLSLYWYGYQQLPMVLVIRNTTDEAAARCRETVRATVRRLLSEGLDRRRLHAIIDRNEFEMRDINTSRPRGLTYFSRAMGQWLYGGDPAAGFDISGLAARLRRGVDNGLFEKCLREIFLDNPHHVELTFSPDARLMGAAEKRLADALARRQKAMTPAARDALRREGRELAAYQAQEDSMAAKATIPALSLADIPVSETLIDHSRTVEGDVVVFKTKPTSAGIVYLTLCFPMDALTADELVKVPLLAGLLGKLPTATRGALALQTEMLSCVGRLEYAPRATARGNYFCVNLAVLEGKDCAALALLKEVLCATRYEDVSVVARVLKQKRLAAERKVRSRGDSLARSVASRALSRRWASNDVLHGYAQWRWLQATEATGALVGELGALARRLFTRGGLILSSTDNLSPEAARALRALVPDSDGPLTRPAAISFPKSAVAAVRIDGDTGYSGTVAPLPDGCAYDGSMAVAARVISLEHLYREIREIGGAYGAGMSLTPSGLISAYTYRNPTPAASLAVIRKSGDALRSFAASDRDLSRLIVATLAGLDPYLPPADVAAEPLELYLAKRSAADRAAVRKEAIGTTRADLLRLADLLDRQLATAEHFVVGGERQTKEIPAERIRGF